MKAPNQKKFKGRININNSLPGKDLMNILRERLDDKTANVNEITRPLLYSERKDGVIIEGDPRTDKWDIMQAATTEIARTKLGMRGLYDEAKGKAKDGEKVKIGGVKEVKPSDKKDS